MAISSLKISNFRNFHTLDLSFFPNFNFFYGDNGSGKTSLLEAIYFLSYGKSFRTHLTKNLITNAQNRFTIYSIVSNDRYLKLDIGVQKDIHSSIEYRLLGRTAQLSELSSFLPIQILHHASFSLLTDGPSFKRQFLDWGLFYLKPDFLELWRLNQRGLTQRNQAIKYKLSKTDIQCWDHSIISSAEKISNYREQYISDFTKVFNSLLDRVFNFPNLEFKFYPGWPLEINYFDVLQKNFSRDFELGYTSFGCHRADLKISIDNQPIEQLLSRGQQKIFVWLMRVAQSILLFNSNKKAPIILIDDLTAELDSIRAGSFLEILTEVPAQYFITTITPESIKHFGAIKGGRMFHVKHNQIENVSRET